MPRPLSFKQALERARAMQVHSSRADDLLTSEYSLHLLGHVYRWLPPLAARWLREFTSQEGVEAPERWNQSVETRYQHFLRERLAARSLNPEQKWPHLSGLSADRGSFRP